MVRGSSNGDSNEHLRRRIWHTTFDETTRCSLAGNKAVNVCNKSITLPWTCFFDVHYTH